jgi:DNA repair protein RadC
LKYIPRYSVSLVREKGLAIENYPTVCNSGSVFSALKPYFDTADRESFVVVTLDTKNRIIGLNTVSIGSLSASVVHPREVFKFAILQSAAAVLLIHNHPSGDPSPSREDRECTTRLNRAGQILGIRVLDHIVIGQSDYFSFADSGLIERTS